MISCPPSGSPTPEAEYLSVHAYSPNESTVRFKGAVSIPDATSERLLGFALSNFSQYVAIHLNGTSVTFACKDGAGEDSTALTDDLTISHEFEIIWGASAARLYIDRALKATISTHIPATVLNAFFGGRAI